MRRGGVARTCRVRRARRVWWTGVDVVDVLDIVHRERPMSVLFKQVGM